jgi:DnaD/phage-associated family protein
VDKLIGAGDGNAALLYLYVLQAGGAPSASSAASSLRRSELDISASMELLGRLGLLQYDGPAPVRTEPPAPPIRTDRLTPTVRTDRLAPPVREELPEYTAEDIRREISNGTVFSSLVREVEKSLNKLMSSNDLIKLFGIYDSLGLPPDVILHLVTYCIDEHQKRYGPNKFPTIGYIEKVAYTWEREGVCSLEKAEEYLKLLDSKRSLTGEIKRVLQIRDRELSAGERKYIEGWIALGYTPDVIETAYEKTLLKTGRLAWSYIDSIIGSWHEKGLHTADEIKAKDGRSATPRKPAAKRPVMSPQEDLADIERMKKYLKELREE